MNKILTVIFPVVFSGACHPKLSTTSSDQHISALPALITTVNRWGVDAPDDSDQAKFVASDSTYGGRNGTMGYPEKGYPFKLKNLSDLPTVTDGGTIRFGPAVVDGMEVIQHTIKQGDALRWQGNRSGLVYNYAIRHGHDYWFAWAFKLGMEWNVENSGGHGDRTLLLDTHQEQASVSTPSGMVWHGDSPAGHELWWFVEHMDGSGAAFLYNAAAAPGKWQRVILHYRSGNVEQKPVYDVWFATGTGEYVKLQKAIDPDRKVKWETTPAFGDSLTNTLPQVDYMKMEMYKWTTKYYGKIPERTMWSSGIYGAEGKDLYEQAVAALKPFVK